MSDRFFYYDAKNLAIDPKRPWQLVTEIGCVVGKFSTAEKAKIAMDALFVDYQKGILPCNLSKWGKCYLLEEAV